jgi:PAS domain S-box-containing protein
VEIRTKTILILALTLITLISIIGITSQILVGGGFSKVEDQAAEKDTHRALVALADDINTLDAVAADWASRSLIRTYFVPGAATGSAQSLLDDQTFDRLAINYIIFTDERGAVITGRGYDLEQHRALPIPPALIALVAPASPLKDHEFFETGTIGIVQMPAGSLLVAVRPVHTSVEDDTPNGYIIMARHLDSLEVIRLSSMAQLVLDIRQYRVNAPAGEIDAVLTGASLSGSPFLNRTGTDSFEIDAPTLRQDKNADTIYGYALIRDVYGEPALVMSAEIPRDISQQGTSTVVYFLVLLLLSGIGVGIVMIILLERTVLSRLLSLSSRVSSIGSVRDFSARVSVPGNDEITDLATNVNSMLGELEKSQQHLQVRLNQSEENYRLFFNSIIDMVVVIHPGQDIVLTGTIIEANVSAVELLGLSRSELGGIPFSSLVAPDDHPKVAEFLEKVRAGKSGQVESTYRTSNGLLIPVEMNVRSFDQFGQEALLVIARDITERKAIETLKIEAFQQIEKNMQQFAILNDHIRNPLQGIIGTADLMGGKSAERIIQLAHVINVIVDKLDQGYLESEKIHDFLRKYYGVDKK